jgi:hypothetical protein
VPALNDFVAALAALLAPEGVATLELPHLLRLMAEHQFDTIYHEHFSYFSLHTVRRVLGAHGLAVFDVEELPTHGGSLRVFARHAGAADPPPRSFAFAQDDSAGQMEDLPDQDDRAERMVDLPDRDDKAGRVEGLLARERAAGLLDPATYDAFEEWVRATKRGLLRFLLEARERGERVAGYGAPAKGNTLLNYCGVGPDLVAFTVDRSPHKQGRYLPGTRIPIAAPDRLREERPDYVLILPWNLTDEIVEQMADVRAWGGRFVVAIPEVRIF